MLNIFIPSKKFSESENRVLEQLHRFSFEQLFNGKFTSNFEKYISDQFPLRDFWIGVKSNSERVIGKKENNDVYLGKDNYLMEKFNKYNKKDLKEKINAINSFAKNNPKLNKYFMLVPNSIKVLEEKLPKYAPHEEELEYIEEVKNLLDKDVEFIDVYNELKEHKDEYIYYKTDHHWTTKGAYYAYEKLCKSMGLKYHDNEYFYTEKVTDNFYGSLYSKGGFRNLEPDSINLYIPKKYEEVRVEYLDNKEKDDSLYKLENLKKKDKYTVFFGGNQPLIKVTTNTKNKKKLLLVKDSYANSLIPFLTGNYSEIYIVDLRYYNEDISKLIKDNKIKDIFILYNVKTFSEDSAISNIS
ncbi:DHHW protein [Gottschalkia purinilytica]|uniref:DHHW protein n=2 Tax=Gottschalkia purinilytica TaxID=1503 RepID=A0A0L0WAQ2_GOTPU|nr:DHHW protein [Gottschalkia purinilytica]